MTQNNIDRAEQLWSRAKRMAFWDRGKMTVQQWNHAIKTGNASIIKQSLDFMIPSDFIELVSRGVFIDKWVSWRELDCSKDKAAILDGAWGLFVAGDGSFPVTKSVRRYHPKKINTLRSLIKSSGNLSIYEIAKLMGRNYRRVFDDIKDFESDGVVKLTDSKKNGRHIKIPKIIGIHV